MWRKAALVLLAAIAVLILAAGLMVSLPASPLYMPTTECRVDRTRYDSAPMEQSYAAIERHMGCPGVKVREEDIAGVVRIITYVWRADSWPVGIVRLSFYNDTLQAKSETRFDLTWSWPK